MGEKMTPNATVTLVTEPLSSPALIPPTVVAAAQTCRVEVELEKQRVEEKVGERDEIGENKTEMSEKLQDKPFWLEDDELPPMM